MVPCAWMRSVIVAMLGCLVTFEVHALPTVSEYDLKAAYLYNFALFTTWPAEKLAEDGSAVVFCVIAQDAQAASINGLQDKKIRDRSILVRYIVTPEDARACHVLFIGANGMESMPKMLEAVRDNATLTVTDLPDPVRKEAVISMAIENSRLTFDVNLLSARRARLSLSSKLLKLARSTN
jgi:hypothetical protein